MSRRPSAGRNDPTEAYLARLARLLAGRTGGARVLEEIGDHLADARDDYVAAGLEPAEAARRAVADLGSERAVARQLGRRQHDRRRWRNIGYGMALAATSGGVVGLGIVAGRTIADVRQLAHAVAVYSATAFVGISLLDALRRDRALFGRAAPAAAMSRLLAALAGVAVVIALIATTVGRPALGLDLFAVAAVWALTACWQRRGARWHAQAGGADPALLSHGLT